MGPFFYFEGPSMPKQISRRAAEVMLEQIQTGRPLRFVPLFQIRRGSRRYYIREGGAFIAKGWIFEDEGVPHIVPDDDVRL